MDKKVLKTVCIMCPVGCELTIEKVGKNITVLGNACMRGDTYGKAEITNPQRIVTALIKTSKGVLPVKTTGLIPKNKLKDVLKEIAKINILEAKAGDVVISNILNLNVDIIVTGNYPN